MSKLLEIGQECWMFFGETGSPVLRKGTVEERNEHRKADYSAPTGVESHIQYKVRYKTGCHVGSRVTDNWRSGVFATKEEAFASLGGGE